MSLPAATHFASYRELADAVAARLLDSRAGCDPLSPWSAEVIVPSRGVSDAIAVRVLERSGARGTAALQLRFIDELARAIVNAGGEFPRVATEDERRLAMRAAARAVPHPMMEGRGIAAMLERSYRDARDSGITLAELSARAKRGMRNPQRTQTILRAFSEYERLIAQLDAIDPADLLARAAQLVDAGAAVRPQILAGFYDMTGAQLAFVKALIGAGRLYEVWIPSRMEFARRFATAVGPELPPQTVSNRGGDVTAHDTRDAELREVCARAATLIRDGVPPSEVAITARSLDGYDLRLLHRFAAQEGFALAVDDGTPLSAHRIGRGAATLLRLRDRSFPRGEVLQLVRDGLRVRTRIDADRADYETRRARIAGGTSAELSPLHGRVASIDAYIDLVAELEELTSTIDASFLARIGSLFSIETTHDLQAAALLDDIAATFAGIERWNVPLDQNAVVETIESKTLATLDPRPSSLNPALAALAQDLMRLRGRTFSHLFVVRMEDDLFPQRRIEDPLFPDSDRRALGMREIGSGADEERLLLELLFDSAANVHFSFAAGDGFGKVLRPSRFLRSLGTPSRAAARAEQPIDAPLRPLQLFVKSGTRSPFDGYLPSLAEHIRARLQAISPTQLEDFGECPQKFLLKHILGVSDVDDPERELQINHRDKGSIDHRILETFYRGSSEAELSSGAPSAEMLARLDRIVDAAFDAHEREVPPFNRTIRAIERRATKRILRDFVSADLAELAAVGLMPRHFEYRFGSKHREDADHPEPYVVHAAGIPLRVEGTIDRIDAGASRFRIVDYKSGKALRHNHLAEKIDRGVRLQLALYAMAVADFFGAEPSSVSGTIKPIAGDGKGKFAFALHERRDAVLETLEIFAGSILNGVFPAFPNDSDQEFNSCKYCPVNHSCRTRHDQEERYAVLQQRDPRTLLGGGQP